MNLLSFFFAYKFQYDFLTDLTGPSNYFIANALLPSFVNSGYCDRKIMAGVLFCASIAYLAIFFFRRVLKLGHDARFDQMRSNFGAFLK
jgi:hypothetical protein